MEMDVAVCYKPHLISVERRTMEALGPRGVLVRVGYCGVCPWDLRAFAGLSKSVRYPLQMGHEVSGIVEAVGEEVHALRSGTRVVVDVIRRCGICRACRRGFENRCEDADDSRGGYAQYILATPENVYPLRDTTPLIEAALTEPLACALRGHKRISVRSGDWALVVGSGPLGLLHLQLLKSTGASVIVSDLIDERLEMARRLGADATVNSAIEELAKMVAARTDGYGVDVVVIATSEVEAVRQALPLLAIGGRILLFAGLYPISQLTFDLNLIHYRELLITGSADYTTAEFCQALQLIEDKVVHIVPLITHVYPLTEIDQALATVQAREGLKVAIRCNSLEPFEPEALS